MCYLGLVVGSHESSATCGLGDQVGRGYARLRQRCGWGEEYRDEEALGVQAEVRLGPRGVGAFRDVVPHEAHSFLPTMRQRREVESPIV